MAEYIHLSTSVDTSGTQTGAGAAYLHRVVVNKKATAAVVTVYDGQSSVGNTVAVVDAATSPLSLNYGGLRLPGGLFVTLTGGNADVTVSYE